MQPDCQCPLCGSIVEDIPISLLPERGMVVAGGKFVILTGHESMLLQRLIEVFPRVLTKEAALEWMYQINPDKEPEIKIIDVYICKARKKLDLIGVRIDTVWGKGYALSGSIKPRVVLEVAA